ncbi:DgyrCDS6309 [Dimorphilus gyrociliatus]|uniref:Histone H4 n=1 Tax=Dimorphilus gyrociliatus TaxID=2664684 RepID=A0A7I8VMV6_9ANNE|nr:DgyrCDS6309 [Dimorphilus gyrociliatus]
MDKIQRHLKEKKEGKITPNVSAECVRVTGESNGITAITDDAANVLAEDVTFRLKQLIQEAEKFARHSKRQKIDTSDFTEALINFNVEPLYGFHSQDFIPFRFASGGGRELHFVEEKEVELSEITSQNISGKTPLDVCVKAHWLAIEGVQPSIPENPPPVDKETQKQESVDPSTNNKQTMVDKPPADVTKMRRRALRVTETVHMKECVQHELSVEQQLYYKEITEACVGSDENRRTEALNSLSVDTGLHQMLPRFCNFISEGVKVNVCQKNLALLIYLMRMVKSLLENPTLYLQNYLHQIVPAVATCIVSKQLCLRPDVDNHWALRDFASRLMGTLCKQFSTNTNGIQTRVTRLLTSALLDKTTPLASHYGALTALGELGPEVVETFVIPLVHDEGQRVKSVLDNSVTMANAFNTTEKNSADRVKTAILKIIPPILKNIRPETDKQEDYVNEYGYYGSILFNAVTKLRETPVTTASSSIGIIKTTTSSVSNCKNQVPFQIQTVSQTRPNQKLYIVGGSGSSTPSTPTTPNVRGPNPNMQKLIVVTTPSSLP